VTRATHSFDHDSYCPANAACPVLDATNGRCPGMRGAQLFSFCLSMASVKTVTKPFCLGCFPPRVKDLRCFLTFVAFSRVKVDYHPSFMQIKGFSHRVIVFKVEVREEDC
jgi:hypothetical protein